MIISFGWTSQYLPPNGTKDTTRRLWKPSTFQQWLNAWDNGNLIHDAYDKSPRAKGERIGKIAMIERPFLEPLVEMRECELIREGGMCGTVFEFVDKYFGGDVTAVPAVIRFNFMPMEANDANNNS